MRVSADDLHRLVYNLRIFQVGKNASPAVLIRDDGILRGYYGDQFVILSDWCKVHPPFLVASSAPVGLPPEELKELELWLRTQEGDLEVKLDPYHLYVGDLRLNWRFLTEEFLPGVNEMLDRGAVTPTDLPGAIPPDRFRKLSLVKPGDYPIDLLHVDHENYGPMFRVKAGPSCTVVLSELDREILGKRDDSEWFMW